MLCHPDSYTCCISVEIGVEKKIEKGIMFRFRFRFRFKVKV